MSVIRGWGEEEREREREREREKEREMGTNEIFIVVPNTGLTKLD